ncbi:Mediator of RNA polymerase II transcription subunit 10a, partial [Cucurbita argyrosperma subsp. argyrosperma]
MDLAQNASSAAGTGGSGGNGSVINDTSALTSVDDSNPTNSLVLELDNMGLRKHLLEELEQTFPDEVESYREIRASSAAETERIAQAQSMLPNGDMKLYLGFSTRVRQTTWGLVAANELARQKQHKMTDVLALSLIRIHWANQGGKHPIYNLQTLNFGFYCTNFVRITVHGDRRILICGFLIESLRVYPLCYNQVGFPGLNCFKF